MAKQDLEAIAKTLYTIARIYDVGNEILANRPPPSLRQRLIAKIRKLLA